MSKFTPKYLLLNLRIRYSYFFFYIFFLGDIQAQNYPCKLTTHIQLVNTLDSSFNENIEVFLEKSHRIKFSDKKGQVTFENLCDSVNDFDVVLPDSHFHISLIASANQIHVVKFHYHFVGDYFKIQTIQIHSKRRISCVECPFPPLLNSKTDIFSIFNSNELTLANLLKKIPMIQTTQSGATISKPMIQGMSGIRAPLFWNGARIEGQNWGGDHAPEIALFGDETVELNKGTEALKFGSDLWGNMINFKHKFTTAHHQIDFTHNSEFQSNGNGIKTSGILNFGHDPSKKIKSSYIKFSAMILGNYRVPDGILKNTAVNELALAGGHATKKSEVHYSIYQSETGIYTGSHVGNLTDLNTAIHSTKPLYLAENMSYALDLPKQVARQITAILSNRLTPKLGLYFTFQNNLRQEYAYTRTGRTDVPQININVNSLNAKATYFLTKPMIEIGTEHQFIHQVYGANYLVPDYNGLKSGLYLARNWQKATSKFTWKQEIMARFDLVKRSGFERNENPFKQSNQGFSGGYSIGYHSKNSNNKTVQWQIHLMQLWRQPAPNELYSFGIHHGSASFEEGNPLLKPETGQKIDMNLQLSAYQLLHKVDFSLSGFFQASSNFILLTPQKEPILTVKGAFPAFKYTQAPTIYSGFEYFFRYVKLSKKRSRVLQIENKMNLTIGKYINGGYPVGIPATTLNLNVESEIFQNIFFAVNTIHQFKQIWYSSGSDFLPPPQAATVFKMEIKTEVKSNWEMGIFVDNVTNLTYRNYTDRFRYFMDMPGRNIGVKINYQIHHHKNHKD